MWRTMAISSSVLAASAGFRRQHHRAVRRGSIARRRGRCRPTTRVSTRSGVRPAQVQHATGVHLRGGIGHRFEVIDDVDPLQADIGLHPACRQRPRQVGGDHRAVLAGVSRRWRHNGPRAFAEEVGQDRAEAGMVGVAVLVFQHPHRMGGVTAGWTRAWVPPTRPGTRARRGTGHATGGWLAVTRGPAAGLAPDRGSDWGGEVTARQRCQRVRDTFVAPQRTRHVVNGYGVNAGFTREPLCHGAAAHSIQRDARRLPCAVQHEAQGRRTEDKPPLSIERMTTLFPATLRRRVLRPSPQEPCDVRRPCKRAPERGHLHRHRRRAVLIGFFTWLNGLLITFVKLASRAQRGRRLPGADGVLPVLLLPGAALVDPAPYGEALSPSLCW